MNRFDALAASWDDDPAKVARAQAAADSLRAAIPLTGSGWHALELGSGTGLLSRALAPDLGPITLVDTSEQMTLVAAERVSEATESHVTACCLDLTEEVPATAPYDVAYSLLALHHISHVDQVLAVLHDLLVPGGWVGLLDLDQDPDGSFHRVAHPGAGDSPSGPTGPGSHDHHGDTIDHVHDGFSAAELTRLLTGAGFVDVVVRGAGFTVDKGDPPRSYGMLLAVGRRAGVRNR